MRHDLNFHVPMNIWTFTKHQFIKIYLIDLCMKNNKVNNQIYFYKLPPNYSVSA